MIPELLTEKNTKLAMAVRAQLLAAVPGSTATGFLLMVRGGAPDEDLGASLLWARRNVDGLLEVGLSHDGRGTEADVADWLVVEPFPALQVFVDAFGGWYAHPNSVRILWEFAGVVVTGSEEAVGA